MEKVLEIIKINKIVTEEKTVEYYKAKDGKMLQSIEACEIHDKYLDAKTFLKKSKRLKNTGYPLYNKICELYCKMKDLDYDYISNILIFQYTNDKETIQNVFDYLKGFTGIRFNLDGIQEFFKSVKEDEIVYIFTLKYDIYYFTSSNIIKSLNTLVTNTTKCFSELETNL